MSGCTCVAHISIWNLESIPNFLPTVRRPLNFEETLNTRNFHRILVVTSRCLEIVIIIFIIRSTNVYSKEHKDFLINLSCMHVFSECLVSFRLHMIAFKPPNQFASELVDSESLLCSIVVVSFTVRYERCENFH